jgi:hypothetical protein
MVTPFLSLLPSRCFFPLHFATNMYYFYFFCLFFLTNNTHHIVSSSFNFTTVLPLFPSFHFHVALLLYTSLPVTSFSPTLPRYFSSSPFCIYHHHFAFIIIIIIIISHLIILSLLTFLIIIIIIILHPITSIIILCFYTSSSSSIHYYPLYSVLHSVIIIYPLY